MEGGKWGILMLGKPCNGLGSNFEGNANTKQLNATKPEPVLAKLDIPPTQTLFYYFTYGITIVSDPIPSSGMSTKTLLWI